MEKQTNKKLNRIAGVVVGLAGLTAVAVGTVKSPVLRKMVRSTAIERVEQSRPYEDNKSAMVTSLSLSYGGLCVLGYGIRKYFLND